MGNYANIERLGIKKREEPRHPASYRLGERLVLPEGVILQPQAEDAQRPCRAVQPCLEPSDEAVVPHQGAWPGRPAGESVERFWCPLAQSVGERRHEVQADDRELVHQLAEPGAIHAQRPDLIGGHDGRGPRTAVDEGDLTEEFTGAKGSQGPTALTDLCRSIDQDQERVASARPHEQARHRR